MNAHTVRNVMYHTKQASSDVRPPEDQNQSNLSTTITTPTSSAATTTPLQPPSSSVDQSGGSKIPRPTTKIPTPVKTDKNGISAGLTSSPPQGGAETSKTEPPKSPTSPRSRGSRIPRPTAISTSVTASSKEEGSTTTSESEKDSGQPQTESSETKGAYF